MDTKNLSEKALDSRKQLVGILGLSGFLRERASYLRKTLRIERNTLHSDELGLIEAALTPATFENTAVAVHKNEAGQRLARLLKSGAMLCRADVAQLEAMSSSPESCPNDVRAHKLAYLKALDELRLSSYEDKIELAELR